MLQETLNNWKIYNTTYDQLERWLAEGEQVLRRSSEEKLVSIILVLEINDVNIYCA